MSKIPEIVDTILGPEIDSSDSSLEQDSALEHDISVSDNSKHFLESGCRLWEKYLASQDLPPLSWETSHTRQMFLMSLNIPLNLDDTSPSNKKTKDNSVSPIKISSDASFKDTFLKHESLTNNNTLSHDLDTHMIRLIHLKSDEALLNLSPILLKSHLLELEIILEKSSAYLSHWIEKKKEIENDKLLFEKIIESLVQHTKRQRIEHIKKTYNLKKKS
ncbi:hypothetical protein T552_01037 [Pneumocystis carinii B80]|uniref:Uncharacterized protein n=1 Tax=Pneumocystis carinii (strain B80) TaxID=1408658 RepID=A0A0W4ZNA4_PNEC8|nr:hypothetical protein T552_01037 [Pneumocystis carinii B80]KTW29833.1 hypothetical protein T552_01037 [Pneumocystis carinii B80]